MELFIQVFTEERHEFKNISKEGTEGYLRPSVAYRKNPDSEESVTSVGMSQITDVSGTPKETLITVNDALQAGIAMFINEHLHRQTGLDCYGFVNLVGRKPPHNVEDFNRYWDIVRVDPVEISTGSIIAFCTTNSLFCHAAVCVSDNLFISVFGINGNLEFATFEDLLVPYNIQETYLMIP